MATITVKGYYGDREFFRYRSGVVAWAAIGLVVGGLVETQSNTRAQERLDTIQECTPLVPSFFDNPNFADCLRHGGNDLHGTIDLPEPITQEMIDAQQRADAAETHYEDGRLLVWMASGPFAIPAVAVQWVF